MRQDVDQVHLLSAFSCPCAGGDVQGAYSETIVLDVLEGPFSTIAIDRRVFDKWGDALTFDISMLFFVKLLPQAFIVPILTEIYNNDNNNNNNNNNINNNNINMYTYIYIYVNRDWYHQLDSMIWKYLLHE